MDPALGQLRDHAVAEPYIAAIFSRMDALLPYRTGFSLQQIHGDPVYTKMRAYLDQIVSGHRQDTVACCANILLHIVRTDGASSIGHMKPNSINSVFIVVSMLHSFLTEPNAAEIIEYPSSEILRLAGMNSPPEFFIKTRYMSQSNVAKLDETLMHNLIHLVGHLKSDMDCLETLKRQCEIQFHVDPSHTSHTVIEDLKALRRVKYDCPASAIQHKDVLDQIDNYLDEIMMYMSMKADKAFNEYINVIYRRFSVDAIYIRRMSILKAVHLTKRNFSHYLNWYKHMFNVSKRPSQHALLMNFFASSINDWANYRSVDFHQATLDPEVQLLAESLFDIIYKQFDNKTYTRSHYKLLSCLLLLQPKQIEKFLNDEKNYKSTSQMLKRSMGKINPVSSLGNNNKQKFLSDFISLVHRSPESADCFTKFLLVGCAIESIDKNHYLSRFLRSQYEHLCVELQMDKAEYTFNHTNTAAATPTTTTPTTASNATSIAAAALANSTAGGGSDSTTNSSLYSGTPTSAISSQQQHYFSSRDINEEDQANTSQNSTPSSLHSQHHISQNANFESSNTISSSNMPPALMLNQPSVRSVMEKIVAKLRVHAFAILCTIEPLEMAQRTADIFSVLDTSLALQENVSGGIKLIVSLPLLITKFFPYLQALTPVLTRYLRITATRISTQQKLDLNPNNLASASLANTNAGVWAGPSSSSSTTSTSSIASNSTNTAATQNNTNNVTVNRTTSMLRHHNHNSPGSNAAQGTLAGKVRNAFKASSSSTTNTTASGTSDPSSFAASLNTKLGTFSHNSSFRDENDSTPGSLHSFNNSEVTEVEEPELFQVKLSLEISLITPKLKIKRKRPNFSEREIKLLQNILINLMDTYVAFPFLCYADVEDYPNSDFPKFESHFKRLIDPITTLLVDSNLELVNSVKKYLLSFCQSVSNKVVIRVFVGYIGTSILVDSVAKVCITPRIKDTHRDEIIKFILQLLESRSANSDLKLMFMNRHVIESVHAAGTCGRIIKNFERCIFLGLFSNNVDTIATSRRLLSFWIFVVTNPHHHPNCLDKTNLELAKRIAADKLTGSSLAIKKKLRDHLCHLKEPTKVLLDVWSLMYEKLSSLHGYGDIPDNLDEEALSKYMSTYQGEDLVPVYGEYMASMGGLIVAPSFMDDIRQPFLQKRLESFLNYKMFNLFNSTAKQREICREILCVSVHPYLCGLLMQLVDKYLPKFEETLKNKQYSICELFLSVVRSLCQFDFDALFPHAVTLWKLNFRMLKIINIKDNDLAFLRLKLKFCKLQVLFLSKMDELALTGNISKKNEYARVAADYLENSFNVDKDTEEESKALFSWNENTTNKVTTKLQELKKSELRDLHLDIKVETSMMLKLVFYHLPLDTFKSTGHDNPSARNVIFSNYFNLFVRVLEKLNQGDDGEQSLSNQHRYSSIIKDIIQALINLLLSNPDTGLKYALPLGYHSNSLIRVSLINVFASIVKEIKLAYNKKDMSLIYKGVLDIMVINEPLLLATAGVCPKAEIDTFANALLDFNEDETIQLRMMTSLIRFDILNTTEKNEIMRSNTVGTRLVSLYSSLKASDYLLNLYEPILNSLLQFGESFEIERIDKMSEEEKVYNKERFLKYINWFVDTVCGSIDKMPTGLRLIAKTIFDSTGEQMYDSRYTALSSYLFLRLFNPSIVSPERVGFITAFDAAFKRSLMQIARVIQLIVNEKPVKFALVEEEKELFAEAKTKIWNFMESVISIDIESGLEDIANKHHKQPASSVKALSNDLDLNACGLYFHCFYYDHWLEIRDEFSKNNSKLKSDEIVTLVSGIDKTICSLGLPKRVKGFVIPEYIREDKSEIGVLLYDFLSQSALVPSKENFIKMSITKDGLPLIIVNTLEFESDCTVKTTVYAMLRTLVKYWLSPYCVLWDLTSFSNVELYAGVLTFFETVVSAKYIQNAKRVYLVNPSPYFFEGFKTIQFNTYLLIPEYHFITTDDDVKTLNKIELINYVGAVSNDARVSFRDVSLYQESVNRFVPVKLKVGNNFVQINSSMPRQLKIGNKMHVVHLVDFYKIGFLEDINSSKFTGVSNELSMVDTISQTRVILSSSKRIEIMRTLYYSRARTNSNECELEDDYKMGISPTISIGQLLNICFTGLLSTYDDIRNSSYALLASMTSTLHMNAGKCVDYVNGVVFPYGDPDYIFSVSTSFAKKYPEYTYAFLSGFFQAFKSSSTENKDSILLYVSPWIGNIYKHVYLSDVLRGKARTASLIRKIVCISKDQGNRQAFSMCIWPQLSVEDNLMELTIDEIVIAAIDDEAEGTTWKNIISKWPLKPTIKICHTLIKRLKEKAYETRHNESEIETHTRWVETTVLVKFLAYLLFDSLLFVERYISDIFFIVTIYMDCGPLELRRSLLKLLNRTFHSYLSKPHLSKSYRNIVEKNIELMNSARFKLLFGLTREDLDQASVTRKLTGTELINQSYSISSLCEIFTSFLKDFADQEEYDLQLIKWRSYVMNIIFNYELHFQPRAILIFGSLTKRGMSGDIVCKFLRLVERASTECLFSNSENMGKSLELCLCSLHSFGKSMEGVREDSIFHPLLFWVSYSMLFIESVNFVQYAARYLRITFRKVCNHMKLNTKQDVYVYLFEQRKPIEQFIKQYESLFNIESTVENFDTVLMGLFAKGLESPFTFNETQKTIQAFLKYRYRESLKLDEGVIIPKSKSDMFCHFLFFTYILATSNEDLMDILKDSELGSVKMVTGIKGILIPEILAAYPKLMSKPFCSGLDVIGKFFTNQKVDELVSSRVIALYIESYKIDKESMMTLFANNEMLLLKFLNDSSTATLMEYVLDMLTKMMSSADFVDRRKNKEQFLMPILEGLGGLKHLKFQSSDTMNERSYVVPPDVMKKRYDLIMKMFLTVNEDYSNENS